MGCIPPSVQGWNTQLILLATLSTCFLPVATVESSGNQAQGSFTSLTDAFPQLAGLALDPNTGRYPSLGGQDFHHCCLLAVNQSLEYIPANKSIEKTNDWIQASIEELYANSSNGQFPCGAKYNGDKRGAPVVSVPAGWFDRTCPGWQLSDSKAGEEAEWLLPFIGFLLPAVVFCLTVPRRRKLTIWHDLFVLDMSKIVSWLLVPLASILAGAFAIVDTVLWLSICFAFASPMLLSGLYEALLDHRVINFLISKRDNYRLTLDMRARLLYVILVGNLDIETEVREEDQSLITWWNEEDEMSLNWPDFSGTDSWNPSSPYTHIEMLVHKLRSFRDDAPLTPRQWPLHDTQCGTVRCTEWQCKEPTIRWSDRVQREIGKTKTRLRTMLLCQYSFGMTVAAPVIFFLGQFTFTVIQTNQNLGDHHSSLDLSFGMWYMIIPQLSIVSGLLLAGNNPNTLEGVVALEFEDEHRRRTLQPSTLIRRVFDYVYESRYKPQWFWLRGTAKFLWFNRVCCIYKERPAPGGGGKHYVLDEDMRGLKKTIALSYLHWTILLCMTFLLLGGPLSLGIITAYYTPQVGISCRSFTLLIYGITQIFQLLLWIWAYNGPPHESHVFVLPGTAYLKRKGFFTPTDTTTLWSREKFWSFPTLWALLWYCLAGIFGAGSVLTSLGGTTMQLMGVYDSGKCNVNAQYWLRSHGNVRIIVSSNSAINIKTASRYWMSTGIAASLFLSVVAFCGWWYQRRLRGLFMELVSDIGNPGTERDDILARKPVNHVESSMLEKNKLDGGV